MAMQPDLVARIDSYPYRHRVGEVMTSPAVTAPADLPLDAAARLMRARAVSSLLVVDAADRPIGIATERSLVARIAAAGAEALGEPLDRWMSAPVETVAPDQYLHVAIARMQRLGIRHLAVTDPASGKLVGVLSARALLKERAGAALLIGDEIAAAADGPEMAAIRQRLAALAKGLLAERMAADEVAALVSALLRETSRRAAELAERSLAAEGRMAPAPWCYLVLGSGGRGESLLVPDQDNALVHAGAEAEDGWYAELGRRASDILDAAGVPYCKGKVMASEPACRHGLEGWRRQIEQWAEHPHEENLLSVDIFYDFQPVWGDRGLAERLRALAMPPARSPLLLARLGADLELRGTLLWPFGLFRTENGRLDLKGGGTLPIVTAARFLALKLGETATATPARLATAEAGGLLNRSDREALLDALGLFMRLILEQQIEDLDRGVALSTRVDPKRLTAFERRHLKDALRLVAIVDVIVKNALVAG
jgi:CBS domain-containing protein